MDDIDRALVIATQGGLPLVPRPYQAIAEQVGIPAEEVMGRLKAMVESGVIRRIGAVPNHYAIGWTANGMTVWDVADEFIDQAAGQLTELPVGERVGALDFVTHCYRRPRALPHWPYNLFAMVHGSSKEEVAEKAAAIRALLGDACRGGDILLSSRILKKTGLRIGG